MIKTAKTKKTSNIFLNDKERRLFEQNQAERKLLRRFQPSFAVNRFGPLMFAMTFGLIGVYFAVMSFAATPATGNSAINLSIEPSARSVSKNQPLTVRVWADSRDQPVSRVDASLAYPADKFEFVGVDAAASAFELENATNHSNGQADGRVMLSRSIAAPEGLVGRQLVAKLSFRAKTATGNADMWFTEESRLIRTTDAANILEKTDGSRYYLSVVQPILPKL